MISLSIKTGVGFGVVVAGGVSCAANVTDDVYGSAADPDFAGNPGIDRHFPGVGIAVVRSRRFNPGLAIVG